VTLFVAKSEKALDRLRWGGAFVAVVLIYGGAAWLLLRPPNPPHDVAPAIEIDLPKVPQAAAGPPGGGEIGSAGETKPPADVPGEPPTGEQGSGASRAAGGGGDEPAPGAVKDAAAEAADTAEKPPITQSATRVETPPKMEAAADSGGGGRPAAPPHAAAPEGGAAPSVARTPIDTSITVNQGRLPLRSAHGGPVFRAVAPLHLGLAPPLAASKDPRSPFAGKPNPIAASALTLSHGHAQDQAQRLVVAPDGGLPRNAIGVVIDQHANAAHPSTSVGLHAFPDATTALHPTGHAAGEHGAATTPAGASLAAANAKPGEASQPTNAASPLQAGHHDQALHASQIASIGGPNINGSTMRPASGTGAIGGPAKVAAGVLNGSSFRTRYP
jgi:hypothetical protein